VCWIWSASARRRVDPSSASPGDVKLSARRARRREIAMLRIDGAHGEGGGQLVRTAVALAAIRGMPIRIDNIRARRRNPGLAPQHLAAVRAVAAMCDAHCEGVALRSNALTFTPGRLRGGTSAVEVGTAGSISLVLQAMLPVAVASGQACRWVVRGGTDVRAAPPIDYLRLVLLPLLEKMGVRAALTVVRRGYFPQGGGEVRLEVAPVARLQPFVVEAPGSIGRIEIHAHVTRLARDIGQRMIRAATAGLPPVLPIDSHLDEFGMETAAGPGGAIALCARTSTTILGAARVAERGVPAERLGLAAADELARDLAAGATLDLHAADQMLVFLALASGASAFRASTLSAHARTTMWLLERIAGTRFTMRKTKDGALVQVAP